jgi:uncharacterized membrane protein
MHVRWIPGTRTGLATLALALASCISLGMLAARLVLYGEMKFGFLPGNLLLAWIPLLAALPVYVLRRRESRRWVLLGACVVVWFFFYPNAPYLITDLVHLKTRPPVPRWFDLILMMSFAWNGLSLGYLSLYLMQEIVRNWLGPGAGWSFAFVMLALGSLGVFVGRFLRWNSWEILNPLGLAGKAMEKLPGMAPWEMAAFCAMFFAFSVLIYTTLYALTHLHGGPRPAGNAAAVPEGGAP